jgi:hypothetical protein
MQNAFEYMDRNSTLVKFAKGGDVYPFTDGDNQQLIASRGIMASESSKRAAENVAAEILDRRYHFGTGKVKPLSKFSKSKQMAKLAYVNLSAQIKRCNTGLPLATERLDDFIINTCLENGLKNAKAFRQWIGVDE